MSDPEISSEEHARGFIYRNKNNINAVEAIVMPCAAVTWPIKNRDVTFLSIN